MSRAVLMSIQPKWCELIASGKKTIEVRKSMPKLEPPFKVYIYCTRFDKGKLIWKRGNKFLGYKLTDVSGRVIGEFVCNQIDTYDDDTIHAFSHEEYSKWNDFDLYNSCIHPEDFEHYANDNWLYGWHISDLIIYDKPKELHHFFKPCGDCDKKGTRRCTEELTYCRAKVIKRPPQSWCYVEEMRADR